MLITVNWTIVITFALVWILAIVLTRVFFKPVGRILEDRASRIDGDKDAARRTADQIEADLRSIDDRLKQARAASDAAWAKAELEALKDKSRLVQEIQAESRAQVEKAKRELAEEIERLKATIDAQTGEIAENIERRVLN